MLKETETEETIIFFGTFLSLVAFQLGGGPHGPSIRLRLCQGIPSLNNFMFFLCFIGLVVIPG